MLRLTLEHDQDTPNPLTEEDGRWTLYSFLSKHTNRADPAQFFNQDGRLKKVIKKKLEVGLAFWCDYFEHGQCTWSIMGEGPQCQWDNSPRAGLIIWENPPGDMGATEFEERKKDAANELKEYTEWCNGNCYYYRIERIHTCEHCGNETEPEELDSCSCFIGDETLFESIRETLDDYPDEKVEVTGDAAWLADYSKIRSEPAPTE